MKFDISLHTPNKYICFQLYWNHTSNSCIEYQLKDFQDSLFYCKMMTTHILFIKGTLKFFVLCKKSYIVLKKHENKNNFILVTLKD